VDDATFVALRLAGKGYGGGDPERILGMRVDMVMAALQYVAFEDDFGREYVEMNRGDK
jgi:hypothetical protein